ncbi:Protein ABIL4 [Raphanus sativus]|uniref:Protein ABIL4 n=1 Tax=Raphanus sativus TaxID=3726 RepID=A0A9W3C659_RAPSA|nr:protein ABIL4 [Raphanus sativus]KAJ4885275.1 Protein ABIL4 [Raphanus sativus]
MESSASLAIVLHQSANHDELFMQQTLQFSQTLKDLKNLRKQLYSAAEYFETSYGKEEHKETVIETLKEYAAKAVVNTVDHLGSVSDKFNSFLSDNSAHFSTTHLRLSSLEQRMKLCREYMGKSGTSHHCFLIQSPPHHHKRYFFPQHGRGERGRGTSFSAGDDSHRFKSAVRSTILEKHTSTTARKAYKTGSFSFLHNNMSNNRTPNSKRGNSPLRFPLLRSGSQLKHSSSPGQPRILALLPEPERAISLSTSREIVEIKQKSSLRKGKKSLMLKALMSMSSKSRN